MKKVIGTIVVLAILCSGCMEQLNPETGLQETVIAPETIVALDTAAEAAPGLAGLLALLGGPWGVGGGALLTGLAGMWVRMKPRVAAATTEAEKYHAATKSMVEAIEQYRAENPTAWATLSARLGENMGANTEAVIRAIRGLPVKD